MRILAFAAALRAESVNRKLIVIAAGLAREAGATVDFADFHEFDMPLYDGDLETRQGLPAGAVELVRRVQANDGLLIATPEYNFSIPGTLKNAIDWLSRYKPNPVRGKSALLMSASKSSVGGQRGLLQTRIPLEALGVFVYPDMFSVARAPDAFAEDGSLKDTQATDRLRRIIHAYLVAGRALAARDRGD
jgi:NAD(P)H-dependent FMN reductase